LPIDAVPFAESFNRDQQVDMINPDAEAIHASTIKLLDLVAHQQIGLVIFGHDSAQWKTLKKAPLFYE
jgi:N-acyl homoserine lactone hydrolase